MKIRFHHISRQNGRLAGFTLIEIMLVMIIISILAGAILTNMSSGYATLALDCDAKGLSETIQAAQGYARGNRCICQLAIDVEQNEYSVTCAATVDQPFKPLDRLGGTLRLSQGIRFAEAVKLKSSNKQASHQIKFFPDGTAEPSRITLESKTGEERIIEISALAGIPSGSWNTF